MPIHYVLIYLFATYCIGSLCSAIIVCQLFRLPDPRSSGSNNPGATNVLRIAGKSYALVVLLMDALKGWLPVLLAKTLGADAWDLGWIACMAVLGHIYPVFFNFNGGKGVATTLGALLGLQVSLGGLVIGTWLLVALITRYSSLASLIAMVLMPIYAGVLFKSSVEWPLCLISILIIYQHRHNCVRLWQRTESRIK